MREEVLLKYKQDVLRSMRGEILLKNLMNVPRSMKGEKSVKNKATNGNQRRCRESCI